MSQSLDAIYVVNLDAPIEDGIQTLLSTFNIPVIAYKTPQEFLDSSINHEEERGCVIFDAEYNRMGSVTFLKLIKQSFQGMPIVVMCSIASREVADRMLVAGANFIVDKPLCTSSLVNCIEQVVKA